MDIIRRPRLRSHRSKCLKKATLGTRERDTSVSAGSLLTSLKQSGPCRRISSEFPDHSLAVAALNSKSADKIKRPPHELCSRAATASGRGLIPQASKWPKLCYTALAMAMQNGLRSSDCSKYLKALADPDRLRIIEFLRGGPRAVGDISQELRAPVANVSHHLKKLRRAGLVLSERQGRLQIYSLPPQILRQDARTSLQVLDFGCCRLELEPSPDRSAAVASSKTAVRPRRRARAPRRSPSSR